MNPAVVILAGGEGRRIGGGKPLRRLAGETLLARTLAKARRWSSDVRVAARPRSELPGGIERIEDDPAIEGPLGGIAAALAYGRRSGHETVLTIPCDMPFLPDDLPGRLAGGIGDAQAAIAFSAGAVHPVCGLWRSEALALLPGYLGAGGRSLRGFAHHVGHAEVEWPAEPLDPFFNINSAADLARAESLLGLRSR